MTDRPTASTINDAQLDQLYDDLAAARAALVRNDAPPICELPHQTVAEEDECERERVAGVAPSCSPGTGETEPNNPAATEATGLRTRVTGLYEQWVKAGPPPLGVSTARWWDRRLVELHDAIHAPAEQPRTTPTNPASTGMAETDTELHARRVHPEWEYRTTTGPRKHWHDMDVPPRDSNGEPEPGWERNHDAGRDGWNCFDHTEESYWRRRKED